MLIMLKRQRMLCNTMRLMKDLLKYVAKSLVSLSPRGADLKPSPRKRRNPKKRLSRCRSAVNKVESASLAASLEHKARGHR